MAVNVDLGFWLKEIGSPSTPLWRVKVLAAFHSPDFRGVIEPVKGKPGTWVKVGEFPEPQEVA